MAVPTSSEVNLEEVMETERMEDVVEDDLKRVLEQRDAEHEELLKLRMMLVEKEEQLRKLQAEKDKGSVLQGAQKHIPGWLQKACVIEGVNSIGQISEFHQMVIRDRDDAERSEKEFDASMISADSPSLEVGITDDPKLWISEGRPLPSSKFAGHKAHKAGVPPSAVFAPHSSKAGFPPLVEDGINKNRLKRQQKRRNRNAARAAVKALENLKM
ncbi:hypothetical protein Aduo_014159 [Ancylostoma duodenale]